MPEIISRKEARARGLKRYFTGKPCKHGHLCERNLIGKSCIQCMDNRARAWARAHPEKVRESNKRSKCKNIERIKRWRLENREKEYVKAHKRRQENPEKTRAICKRANLKRREKNNERIRKMRELVNVLRLEMPELLKEFGL